MGAVRNILFIMADQHRADYLSCMGHPSLETPHLDALAGRGVRFTRAYCQAPICGPSRMSFYTGRYMFSHGSHWNSVPLKLGERTMGEYLRPLGLRTVLVGKTHFTADSEGMRRVGLDPKSSDGALFGECGFEAFERDDGLHPQQSLNPNLAYNTYLRAHGFGGENPWRDWANSAEGPDGEILSGWNMRYAPLPARVPEEHSETAYMTNRAMEFIDEAGEDPWCLHLSYIKPHWPYVAPAPYHAMYGPNQVLPAVRSDAERDNPHPVHAAFMDHVEGKSFAREEVRQAVIPAYMGLIKQIDDHMGRLMTFLDERGRLDDTMIVYTSDHGDYLGDHWLGEKELFHEASVRIPMIVVDPDTAADATRGTADSRLVEAIDLLPTFLDVLGGEAQPHWLEGRSLSPLLRGHGLRGHGLRGHGLRGHGLRGNGDAPVEWRDAAIAEADYAFRAARWTLDRGPADSRAYMVRTDRWKYIHYEGFRPQLFDLDEDPDELSDLGECPDHAAVRADLHERLFEWLRQRRLRTTLSDDEVAARTDRAAKRGFLIGVW